MDKMNQPIKSCLWGMIGLLQVISLGAQEPYSRKHHVSVGGMVEGAYLLSSDEYDKEFIRSHGARYYGLNVRLQSTHQGGDAYDDAFRFPSIEVGVLWGDFHRIRLAREGESSSVSSGLGHMLALYGAFRRDVVSAGPFHLNYLFENGVGWSTRPYDGHRNPNNELIGSRLSVYFGMGVGGRFRLSSQWEAGLDLRFRHFSNGALNRPNKGVNTVGASVGLRYYLSPLREESVSLPSFPSDFHRHFYWDMSVGWIAKTLIEDWLHSIHASPEDPRYRTNDFHLYSGLGISAAAMYRYSLRFASGLGIDYGYLPYVDEVARYDRETQAGELSYSRHSLGLSLRHEVFYKQFSLYFSLGYYLHRHTGHLSREFEKPYYETLGLRYTFPFLKNVYVGYHVKAHLFRADHIEFNVGWRIP